MKIPPGQAAPINGYFGPEDTTITAPRAAELLGCSEETIRRYIVAGLLRGCRLRNGAHYQVSKLSVLELKARLQPRVQGCFGPEDTIIMVPRAAKLLGCCQWSIRRYIEAGLLCGVRVQNGAFYRVSKLSVLELKARLQRQAMQVEPPP